MPAAPPQVPPSSTCGPGRRGARGVRGVRAGARAHVLPTGEDMVRPPTGEATAFFALHGACAVAEAWWARHQGWWRLPRLVATPSTASPHRSSLRGIVVVISSQQPHASLLCLAHHMVQSTLLDSSTAHCTLIDLCYLFRTMELDLLDWSLLEIATM
ncbi:hypothetical protein ZWY2020_028069 [Hordeum vulgare]|nr:hypothetical protein ZWY2020_028069 [Hordeum vulgare]